MLYRIKQFFKGFFCVSPDISIAEEYLNTQELQLFMKLPSYEKRHAIDTAVTLMGFNTGKNRDILIEAALLHDIGKLGSGVGLIKKSILVLMNRFFPDASRRLAKNIKMFNVYYNHNIIGAGILKNINADSEVIELVKHHQPWDNFNIEGIELLKKADSLN